MWWSCFGKVDKTEKEKWKRYWVTLCVKKLNDIRLVSNHELKEVMDQIKRALDIRNGEDLQRIQKVMVEMKANGVSVCEQELNE